jgi:hypothetical protein
VAEFSYASISFYPEDITAVPQLGAATVSNGFFTGTNGLVIDPLTGVVDVVASAFGAYQVTYTTDGDCSGAETVDIKIEKDFIFNNGAWTPNDPSDLTNPSTRDHSIQIMEDIVYGDQLIAKNIIIAPAVYVSFTSDVSVYNKLDNQGNMISTRSFTAAEVNNTVAWFSNKASFEVLAVENSNLVLTGNYIINSKLFNNDATSTSIVDASNADVIFRSTADKTAVIDGAFINVIGSVDTENFMESRRSFRFLSSSVSSTTSIYQNWQESGDDLIVGLGTHITGAGGTANGFDTSGSNNPSMFGYDNLNQSWIPQTSTNQQQDVFTAGKPYRLLVRGDRQTDLTSNSSAPSRTVLRANGTLENSSKVVNDIALNSGEYMMIGNPYQSNLDLASELRKLLTNSSIDLTAVDPNFYYVWDALGNQEGVYRTYDLVTNSFVGAQIPNSRMIPGTIAPGQSFFIAASGAANGNVILNRTSNDTPLIPGLRNQINSNSSLMISLFDNTSTTSAAASIDGLMIRFENGSNNGVDNSDAVKFSNIDENMARQHTSGSLLSIENRALPFDGEELQLFNNNYRNTNYIIEVAATNLGQVQGVLVDNLNSTRTILNEGQSTSYSFTVDNANAQSIASDRFKIVFENTTLGVDDVITDTTGIKIYPNPATGDFVTLDLGLKSSDAQVSVYNVLGQLVSTQETKGLSKLTIHTSDLSAGTYLVKVVVDGQKYVEKLLVK